jgi:hypothetical protein
MEITAGHANAVAVQPAMFSDFLSAMDVLSHVDALAISKQGNLPKRMDKAVLLNTESGNRCFNAAKIPWLRDINFMAPGGLPSVRHGMTS